MNERDGLDDLGNERQRGVCWGVYWRFCGHKFLSKVMMLVPLAPVVGVSVCVEVCVGVGVNVWVLSSL